MANDEKRVAPISKSIKRVSVPRFDGPEHCYLTRSSSGEAPCNTAPGSCPNSINWCDAFATGPNLCEWGSDAYLHGGSSLMRRPKSGARGSRGMLVKCMIGAAGSQGSRRRGPLLSDHAKSS